jgi:hypothetical protein
MRLMLLFAGMSWSLKEWQSLIKLLQDLEDAPHDRALFDKAEKQLQSLLHAEGWAAMTPAALSKLLKKQVRCFLLCKPYMDVWLLPAGDQMHHSR